MTGGQDWASELIETGGQEVNEILIAELAKRIEALEKRVQELELKNTCFGPMTPSGSSAAEQVKSGATARQFCNPAEIEYVKSLLSADPPIESWLRRMADAEDAAGSVSVGGLAADTGQVDPPKRGWLVVVDAFGKPTAVYETDPNKFVTIPGGWRLCEAIPAPTDAEIESAVRVGLNYHLECTGTSIDADCISHAIRHLLGRTEK